MHKTVCFDRPIAMFYWESRLERSRPAPITVKTENNSGAQRFHLSPALSSDHFPKKSKAASHC